MRVRAEPVRGPDALCLVREAEESDGYHAGLGADRHAGRARHGQGWHNAGQGRAGLPEQGN